MKSDNLAILYTCHQKECMVKVVPHISLSFSLSFSLSLCGWSPIQTQTSYKYLPKGGTKRRLADLVFRLKPLKFQVGKCSLICFLGCLCISSAGLCLFSCRFFLCNVGILLLIVFVGVCWWKTGSEGDPFFKRG